MGNTCSTTTSIDSNHVVSIRQVGSPDELTFTDIDDAWTIAHRDVPKMKGNAKSTVIKRTGWITVRVFVSSTFRDFDAEREILVKQVFPDLREWCQSRRLHLVECDLRWGVPKDSTTETTLRTCLGEIDRCYAENLMPFFVNMTSERIGWIPLGEQVPSALRSEYRWVEGMSVTEMEIMHGAYRIDNPNALFMIRDSSFLKTVPEEHQHHFIDEYAIAKYKLERLKAYLARKFEGSSRLAYYTCEYASIDKDTKMPRFKGLDVNFTQKVLEFFKERIAAQYPLIDEKKQDPYEEAHTQHDSFMKMASEKVVGREALINQFVSSYVDKVKDIKPVVVYGGPGLGKTSIMSALVSRCCNLAVTHKLPTPTTAKRWRVFFHFVGAVSGSTDQLAMLNRLLLETKTLRKENKPPTSLDEAMGLVRGALSNPKTKNCIIVIDAINQFDDYRGMPAPITWLPNKLSPTIRLFVSLTPESNQFKSVRKFGDSWVFVQLQPLDRETKQQMVISNLARYNKRLDAGQMELLLNKKSSDNPMWLSLATEELRIFGRFRELTNKIGALPDGLADLEAGILSRFEREGDGMRLVAALCLMECSVHGLLESELLELLADSDILPPVLMERIKASKTSDVNEQDLTEASNEGSIVILDRLTAKQWSDIYRVLRPFMRPFGASGEGRLDFYHRSLSKAVRARYYYNTAKAPDGTVKQSEKREDVIKWFHGKLAAFFGERCKHLERRVEEYPTHAYRSGDKDGLISFLCNWQVIDLMYDPEFARELSQSWERVYYLSESSGKEEQKSSNKSSFELMETHYFKFIENEMNRFKNDDGSLKREGFRPVEQITRLLMQNGRYTRAYELATVLEQFSFPNVESVELLFSDVPFIQRDYSSVGEKFSTEDRLVYARIMQLKAQILDEDTRQIEYSYASQVPGIIKIIIHYEVAIGIFRKLAPTEFILGKCLNRVGFWYQGVKGRGGHQLLPSADCITMARNRIELAIQFYSAMEAEEINLADCYITRGVIAENPTDGVDDYMKGLNIILETAGQLHPLLDRCYLNIGIYYEEASDRLMAYSYFRKWYDLMAEIYGRNHPKIRRAVSTLNENAYVRIAKELGAPVPQLNATDNNEDDGDDDDVTGEVSTKAPPQQATNP